MDNMILTWENLIRHGFSGPNLCILCMRGPRTMYQLFLNCDFSRVLWKEVVYALNLWGWGLNVHLESCLGWWLSNMGHYRFLLLYISWDIWKVWNRRIFESPHFNISWILPRILAFFFNCLKPLKTREAQLISFLTAPQMVIVGFFDETQQRGIYICGGHIYLHGNFFVHFLLNAGGGSNTKAKIVAI